MVFQIGEILELEPTFWRVQVDVEDTKVEVEEVREHGSATGVALQRVPWNGHSGLRQRMSHVASSCDSHLFCCLLLSAEGIQHIYQR